MSSSPRTGRRLPPSLLVIVGALVVGAVGVGVLAEARALGGWAALQPLVPAVLVAIGAGLVLRERVRGDGGSR